MPTSHANVAAAILVVVIIGTSVVLMWRRRYDALLAFIVLAGVVLTLFTIAVGGDHR